MSSKTTVYIDLYAKGPLAVPGGRTGVLGMRQLQISDGSSVPIGGSGPVELGVATLTLAHATPSSGPAGATAVNVTTTVVNANSSVAVGNPTGYVTTTVQSSGGYTLATQTGTLNGDGSTQASFGAGTFATPGTYTIKTQYQGDTNYAPNSSQTTFTAT